MSTHQANSKPKIIKFYRAEGNYGWLSNFSRHSVILKGVSWSTAEHYYQAQKFGGSNMEEIVRNASTPREAKKLGNDVNGAVPLRKDWPSVKEYVMYDALKAKFTQHTLLREKLLETGDAILVESTTKDKYWGDGGNGSGLNRLGALLMYLRDELGKSAPEPANITSEIPKEIPEITPDNDFESFSESDDGFLSCGNPNKTEEEEENTQQPIHVVDYYSHKASVPTSSQKARKKKTLRSKMRKNVWKDGTGGSIIEKNNQVSGQVTVVNTGIQIPTSSLPPQAKLVVHQNQFRRRWVKDSDDRLDASDEDGDCDYDADTNTNNNSSKITLGDYISSNKKVSQPIPEHLISPSSCIASTIENISLYQSLPSDDPLKVEIAQNLTDLKSALIQFVEQSQTEQLTSELLQQIETLNDLNL